MSRFTDLVPELTDEQFQALVNDIAERGCLVPIELDENGEVLDGAHRLRACQQLGINPPTITRHGLTEDEKAAHAIALNIQRRHLGREQRAELHRKLREAGRSLREIAEASGSSAATVMRDVATVSVETVTGLDGREQPARRPHRIERAIRHTEETAHLPNPSPRPTVVLDFDGAITKRQQDQGVHFSSATDEWATPQPLFDRLDREFSFDLDVCALDSSAKCDRYFTPEDDGLLQTWTGTCWMNPPYGDAISGWMDKAFAAANAGATVVCLVPARTDTAWWWRTARLGQIRFLKGRLKFGEATSGAPFPSAVVVFAPGIEPDVVWWNPEREVLDVAA